MKIISLFVLLLALPLRLAAEATPLELFKAINNRLSLMEDVALFKAYNRLPIEDVEREKIVIGKAKTLAYAQGLDPEYVEDFFKAQISVAKAIQFRHRADWLSKPAPREVKDLQKELRPQLLRLGNRVVELVTVYIKSHGSFKSTQFSEFDAIINVKHVTTSDKRLLFEALQKVKLLSES